MPPRDDDTAPLLPEEIDAETLPGPGDSFAHYRVEDEIGRGGMGVVYRARNRTLGRIVALKVLFPSFEARGGKDRFLREARALARIEHHNVVTVYHVGKWNDLFYIEMQYVDGPTLADLIAIRPLEPDETVRILEQVAHALSHAHRRGVIHRDIKPSNILLTSERIAKVVDFGLAKPLQLDSQLTAPGLIVGSPTYMAPEQWAGEAADQRTDLYLLGATAYEMLSGGPPFSGGASVLMDLHRHARPKPLPEVDPAIPQRLGDIVDRLLAKSPDDRYQSATDLVTDLRLLARPAAPEQEPPQTAVEAEAGRAPPGGPVEELETRRPPRLVVAGLVGVAVSLAVLTAGAFGWIDPLELMTLDRRFACCSSPPGESAVSLVVIDQESKERLSPGNPLSRERHIAPALGKLGDLGAVALGVDLLISDRISEVEDGTLAAFTRLLPQTVHSLNLPESSHVRFAPRRDVPHRWRLPLPVDGLPRADFIEPPIPELVEATRLCGHVSLSVDPDGVVRRVPHLIAHEGSVYPSLSLAVVMTALGVEPDGVRFVDSKSIELQAASGEVVRIPVDDGGRMLIDFRQRDSTPGSYPLARLISSAGTEPVPSDALRGKVVFVGSRLEGDYDVGAMPGARVGPLLLAHATAAETILKRSFIVPANDFWKVVLVLALALGGSWAASFLRPLLAVAALILTLVLYFVAGLWWFSRPVGTALPLAAPSLSLVSGFASAAVIRLLLQDREKRVLRRLLSRYLSPAVTRRLLNEKDALRLGGRRKEITILCVDVHGFSEVSERVEPEEVDEFLRAFFARLTDVVFRHDGTLDQFTGSGMRAFFGDPEPQEDHALRGVLCALEIRGVAARVARAWSRRGRPLLETGIAVHTGYVTVGNIGSPRRMEYTVLGRNVEIVERLARLASGKVLVSSRTRALTEEGVAYQLDAASEELDSRDMQGLTEVHEALSPR